MTRLLNSSRWLPALLALGLPAAAAADPLSDLVDGFLDPNTDLGGEDVAYVDHSAASLYSGPAPRPGPDVLYAPAPWAPQLENTRPWKAAPIMVSGASAYRRGEFIYQDYVYDDHGADGVVADPNHNREDAVGTYMYPADPVYAQNAADFVELRVKKHRKNTLFRVTVNALLDPQRVGFTIALGDSAAPRAFPFGANVQAPAQLFLTVHGDTAVLTDAATGAELSPAPTVVVDSLRRAFHVVVQHAAWNPGEDTVRMAAGIGLWDTTANRYLVPGVAADATTPGGAGVLSNPPAFFNVAFRYNEDLDNSKWGDTDQAAVLASGDISPFHAMVDFRKVNKRVTDQMHDQPNGTPTRGSMVYLHASHAETKQGADWSIDCADRELCAGQLRGQLQPYAIYVPYKAEPADGWGLTLLLHSLGESYLQYHESNNQVQLGERGDGHIVITPTGRGPDGWYYHHAGANTFETWADVARRFRLNPENVVSSGYSMGGYGTYKFTTRYPDLFAKAYTTVGPPSLGIWAPPAESTGGTTTNTHHLLEGLRHIPTFIQVQAADELVPYTSTFSQAARLDELGYRYRFDTFTTGEHLTLAIHDQYAEAAEFLGEARVVRDPVHVSYVVNPHMDFPEVGTVGDHAYWLSGMTVRDADANLGMASVDARSHASGETDPQAGPKQYGAGVSEGALGAQAYVSEYRTWGLSGVGFPTDRLDLTVRNLATLTIHPQRAGLSCDADLRVDSDGPVSVHFAGCDRTVRY